MNDRIRHYDQIFELVYYGEGGFTFEAVYNMPVFIRNYYYNKLYGLIEKRNQEIKKANSRK